MYETLQDKRYKRQKQSFGTSIPQKSCNPVFSTRKSDFQ